MDVGILDTVPVSGNAEFIVTYLKNTTYDEMLELCPMEDRYCEKMHIPGKYYMPKNAGTYREFYRYVLDYLIHPEDKNSYIGSMHPDLIYEKLEHAKCPGTMSLFFRVRGMDREWRRVEQILICGERFGLPHGVIYCFVYEAQEIGSGENAAGGVESGESETIVLDTLTGLLDRKTFFKEAEKLLAGINDEWLLISMDIENFKLFNDWYGWDKGNLVLTGIGEKLKELSEATQSLVGYMENDDFCILTREETVSVEELYNDIHSVIADHGVSVGFLPSFGISRTKEKITVMELFDQAALASSRAKGDFKHRICYFTKEMLDEKENEYALLSDFQQSLSKHEISFFLQPQCRASTGAVIGAEALARWTNTDGTKVPPSEFVPVLEKYGFVPDLDKYIWEEVAIWIRKWLDKGHPLIPISVNVSQIDIFTVDVPAFFRDLIARYELPWNAIKIEITESACAEDSDQVREVVQKLRSMGFPVLMDDFGSGYSSLNMLHELEMDAIKMDARFLRYGKNSEEKGIHILESVVNMAKTMGMPIIVEGVENQEQKEFLMHLGCRYMQGFYFYRPLKPAEFEKLISDNEKVDLRGMEFKANEQFQVREFLDRSVYSDSMLNNILGPVAIYSWENDRVDIIRFNEQFYEAVMESDFNERLRNIQEFMPPEDAQTLICALKEAMDDRMNGRTVMLNFNRSDGGISRFLIHFYYLGREGESREFYGSARDVTRITMLQKHLELLSGYFSECIIFLERAKEGYHFNVAANGLAKEMGLSGEELENELNAGKFFERVVPEQRATLLGQSRDAVIGINFTAFFTLINAEGSKVKLFIRSDYVDDPASDVQCIILISRRKR